MSEGTRDGNMFADICDEIADGIAYAKGQETVNVHRAYGALQAAMERLSRKLANAKPWELFWRVAENETVAVIQMLTTEQFAEHLLEYMDFDSLWSQFDGLVSDEVRESAEFQSVFLTLAERRYESCPKAKELRDAELRDLDHDVDRLSDAFWDAKNRVSREWLHHIIDADLVTEVIALMAHREQVHDAQIAEWASDPNNPGSPASRTVPSAEERRTV